MRTIAIEVYLNFNGNCREAVEFYAKVFKSEPTHMTTFGEMPPDPNFTLPEETKELIMHARLNISGSTIMFSDVFPGMPFVAGNNVSLAFVSQDAEEIQSAFRQLKEEGKVQMELQETFWSKCYGSLSDKFGIEWQFSHVTGDLTM